MIVSTSRSVKVIFRFKKIGKSKFYFKTREFIYIYFINPRNQLYDINDFSRLRIFMILTYNEKTMTTQEQHYSE